MSQIPQNVNIGTLDLVTAAGNYNQYRTTSNVVNVNDGAQYNIEVKTGGPNGVDLAAAVKELNAHISAGCMHDSAVRVDAPKCHEDTRKAVQDDVFSWMSHSTADEVLWLTGPAGAGKSAIMGTVCDRLKQSGQLAATFFFAVYLRRMSKQGFVTTLAYQLQRHPNIRESISQAMLAAICHDPAVFEMSLKEQAEILILQPLRSSRSRRPSNSTLPMAIVIDGVDECGEATYGDSNPDFPFRVIIASRPETWIRGFFANLGTRMVTEIFLDDKYNPDDDIRLFLKSKFADLCRRYGLDPSTWPSEEVIAKLVRDASGQFIYVATVLRFIDTPGTFPQPQLAIVLKIKPRDKLNPFSVLDALYTSILRLSPSPETTVLWLRALHLVQQMSGILTSSTWTVDRIFESNAGQAQILLGGLPSLIYPENAADGADSVNYESELGASAPLVPQVGWTVSYAFYHKSFPDYLEDPLRCGDAFPAIDNDTVEQWLSGRLARTLIRGGPEVPINRTSLFVFRRCFLDALTHYAINQDVTHWRIDDAALSRCEPAVWLDVHKRIPSAFKLDGYLGRFLYTSAHNKCRSYLPCNPGCKRWRRAISKLPKGDWRQDDWTPFALLLDRFNVRRIAYSEESELY